MNLEIYPVIIYLAGFRFVYVVFLDVLILARMTLHDS